MPGCSLATGSMSAHGPTKNAARVVRPTIIEAIIMQRELEQAFASLRVESPLEYQGMRVFGLRWHEPRPSPEYATLDEALQRQDLEVTEISEGGSVPRLQVVNHGDTMVFIMAGEELVGAKQNRVLNVSMMVKPHSEQPIPVSCVEAGRWSYRSKKFSSSDITSHGLLRGMMSRQVHESYRRHGTPNSAQGAVWQEISRKLRSMGSRSASSELRQVFEDRRAKLDEILAHLQAPTDWSGAVFVQGNRIAGLDLFDKPGTLAKLWAKILRGYAIDTLEKEEETPSLSQEDVLQWLASLAAAQTEEFASPGTGRDVRMEAANAHGAALLVEHAPIHVEVFPAHSS
jgi:hypothetical protein